MDPAGKRPSNRQENARPVVRKLRFDPAHPRLPKPPHHLAGKNRPNESSDGAA